MVDQYVLLPAGSGPSYTPHRFGLLSAAELPNSPERWRMGFLRDSPVCGPAESIAAIPCTGSPNPETDVTPTDTGIDILGGTPTWVYAWIDCSTVGWGDDLSGLRDRTLAALTNGGPRAFERVAWVGQPTDSTFDLYPYLASNTVVSGAPQGAVTPLLQTAAETVTSAAVDPVEALGLLEGRLGECYGAEGIIHVPRRALAHLDYLGLVRQQGEQLRTLSGNRIAAHSGGSYLGPGRAAVAAGQAWFYATGMAQVFRGPVQDFGQQPADFIGRSDNSTVFVVGQAHSWTWDCCHLAAQVSLGGAITGTQGAAT